MVQYTIHAITVIYERELHTDNNSGIQAWIEEPIYGVQACMQKLSFILTARSACCQSVTGSHLGSFHVLIKKLHFLDINDSSVLI